MLQEAQAGRGALVLLTGEAGVGKTRFAETVAEAAGVRLLRGAAGPGAPAYGPVTAALRAFLRGTPDGLSGCGPLRAHLALLLPELGPPIEESDRPTLFEAIRRGLSEVVADAPAVVLLDDLQWSDDATLELLAALAGPLRELPMLVVAAYRSDEVPRAHQLRRLRTDLRRNQLLRELTLEPLSGQGVAELAGRVLGSAASPRLSAALHDRTCGIPFFVEELAGALESGGRLQPGRPAASCRSTPTCRCRRRSATRCCCGTSDLSVRARAAAEAAAVAGSRFDVELVAGLCSEAGLDELLASGLIVEQEPGSRGVPPPARARRDLRGRAVAATARAASRARRGARVAQRRVRPRWPRTGSRHATIRARSTRSCARSPSAPPSTRTGTPRGWGVRRSTAGRRASAVRSGSRCSSATRAARSWPAS